jgi:hypothetical protein
MPRTRLLAIVLLTSATIASAQIRDQSRLPASPTVNDDAGKSAGQTQREPWQIIPDLTPQLLFPLNPQIQLGNKPYHRLTREEGYRLFFNKPKFDKLTIIRLPDGEYTADPVCYTIRSYVVARDDKDSDSTHPVGSSTCQPASRYGLKNAQAEPVSADH